MEGGGEEHLFDINIDEIKEPTHDEEDTVDALIKAEEQEEILRKTKQSIQYTIGRISEEERLRMSKEWTRDDGGGISVPSMSRVSIAALTTLTLGFAQVMANDITAFAHHAKRSTVTTDE